MWCMQCNKDLANCSCPDLNDRLRSLTNGKHNAARWCTVCDHHYASCTCQNPVWGLRTSGKIEAAEFVLVQKPAELPDEEDCDLCESGRHHHTEHLERADYSALKPGDVVFIRAKVVRVEEQAEKTKVEVEQFEPGYPQWAFWKASVNSVDVFPPE